MPEMVIARLAKKRYLDTQQRTITRKPASGPQGCFCFREIPPPD
jgi:hypothetical protein